MTERPGGWAALILILLAVPVAEAQATRSAQSDCEREAQRLGFRVLSSSNFQQLKDGWQIDLKVRDSRGKVSDGTCFVETRSGAVSLYGFGHDPGLPSDRAIEFNCASVEGKYKECQIPIDGPVRLIKTYSETRCEKGRNWGQRADRVWVDRGCRARFEVSGGSGSWTPEFDQAEQSCRDQARQYGLSAIETEPPKREGSYLRLNLKGQLKGQARTADCRYAPAQRRATVLFREFEGGQGPIAEAKKGCSDLAKATGFEVVGAANAVWDRAEVRVPMIVQAGRDTFFTYCYYDRVARRAELKQQ